MKRALILSSLFCSFALAEADASTDKTSPTNTSSSSKKAVTSTKLQVKLSSIKNNSDLNFKLFASDRNRILVPPKLEANHPELHLFEVGKTVSLANLDVEDGSYFLTFSNYNSSGKCKNRPQYFALRDSSYTNSKYFYTTFCPEKEVVSVEIVIDEDGKPELKFDGATVLSNS